MLIFGLVFAETTTLKVIAVNNGPAGYGTPSVQGIAIYLKDPVTGATVDSATTNGNGVSFSVELNKQFYVTTSAGGATGGNYGFLQELNNGGVPSFKITKSGDIYGLCRLSDNTCSYGNPMIILYKLKEVQSDQNEDNNNETENNEPQHGGEILCIGQSITESGHTLTLTNIIHPATPVDKAVFAAVPSGWNPTLNIDGVTHVYTGNGYNLSIKTYSLSTYCVEVIYDVKTAPTATESCLDYDNGADYYTSSKIVYSDDDDTNKPLADTCLNSGKLMERVCNGNSPSYVEFTCPSDYSCGDGACVQQNTNPQTQKTCSETDGGNNKYTVGTNTIYLNGQYYTSASDSCKNANVVTELTCNGNQWDVSYEACQSGYDCSNGACVQQNTDDNTNDNTNTDNNNANLTSTCVDSDGDNMYTKGTTTGLDYYGTTMITVTDSCALIEGGAEVESGRYVIEMQCVSENKAHSYYYRCPSGYSCGEGACIQSNIPPMLDYEVYTHTIELKKGWNLVSAPVGTGRSRDIAEVRDSTCSGSTVYVYDQNTKTYITSGYGIGVGELVPVPNAFWVKTDNPCKVTFKGSITNSYTPGWDVLTGWVGFGGPYSSSTWDAIAGNCQVASGPWRFNTAAWKWEKAISLHPGEGYFVKVTGTCTLGGGSLPPALPS